MKTIILKINDKVYSDLEQALFVHKLAVGFGGVTDQAINKILKAIKQGNKEVILQYKGKDNESA